MDKNKQYLYPVYRTDSWHSMNSRECTGIYTSMDRAVEAVVKNHEIPLEEFEDEFDDPTEEDAAQLISQELEQYYQTQGHSVNYEIEIWLANDWA